MTLILALLVINIGVSGVPGTSFSVSSFVYGILCYLVTLLVIVVQNRFTRKKDLVKKVVQVELLLFLIVYNFIFNSQYVYLLMPSLLQWRVSSEILSLLLYLGGIWLGHYLSVDKKRAWNVVRFFIPFTLPFLFFELLVDIFSRWGSWNVPADSVFYWAFSLVGLLVFLLAMIMVIPPIIKFFWGGVALGDSALKQRLDALCERAHFKHGGMLVWSVMNYQVTAGIIGILPRLRYVMFTRGLLERLGDSDIEAVLAHEIGHNHHKHLLFYPLVVFGVVVIAGIFFLVFGWPLDNFLLLIKQLYPGGSSDYLAPFLFFLPYALLVLLYLRLVFGFFSRIFERQADLHVIDVGLSARRMADALDSVAVVMGGIHKQPSWHHYSIQQRIDFLQKVEDDPALAYKHHRRVRFIKWSYCCILAVLCMVLIASPMKDYSPWKQIDNQMEKLSDYCNDGMNGRLYRRLAKKLTLQYGLVGPRALVEETWLRSFKGYGALYYPGVAEFYAAQMFLREGLLQASGIVMIEAWRSFDFDNASEGVREDFRYVSLHILKIIFDDEDKDPGVYLVGRRLASIMRQHLGE